MSDESDSRPMAGDGDACKSKSKEIPDKGEDVAVDNENNENASSSVGSQSLEIPDKYDDVAIDNENNENATAQSGSQSLSCVENLEYELKNFKMDNKERGVAIVFNNTFEKSSCLRPRKGTMIDGKKIDELLEELGFENKIQKKVDVSVADMKKELEKVSKEEKFKDMDCFVCVILSYGDEGYVIGKDGDKIEVAELTKYFRGDKVKSLATKPKLFFIQTCPVRTTTGRDGKEGDVKIVKISSRKIPVEANFLILHSCIPGDDIWSENDKTPSLFIEALVKVVKQYRSKLDFLSIMTRLMKEMAEKTTEAQKLPYVSSTLMSDLFFN